MKRLKIPRISASMTLPYLPSIHIGFSHKAKDISNIDGALAPTTEASHDTKVERSGTATLESLSPTPVVSKLSVPETTLPSISMPNISEKSSRQEEELPKVNKNVAPTASSTAVTDTFEQPSEKTKPKASIHKIKMPNLKFSKVSMPSLSLGNSRAKPTGKRILALTIEGTDVRLVSYHNNSVESWKSTPFDARFLKMGQVADPEGLGETIKSSLAGIETTKYYLVCALPGLRAVSRIITIPNVSKKEMEAVIHREVRRTMTVSEEDNYFHWQALPSETPQVRVFILAVPKEPLSLLMSAFSYAGLHPANVDLKPLALMRAVNQRDAIIANCEGNSMELVIVSDDIPVLIRSVFLGEGVVNQDYAVGRISDELGRTIVTYNEINKEHPLDQNIPIYLTGATAAGVPFALNVAALTGRTVQPLEAPVGCPTDFPLAEYMVNIGLILKVV